MPNIANIKLSVISPCFNEGERIEQSVKNTLNELSSLNCTWEYIIVNDGSTDDTLKRLRSLEERHQSLKIISYSTNRGRGYALRKGFEKARGELIITIESDSSWGPDIIRRFLDEMERDPEADIVIASTNIDGGGYKGVSSYRKFLSRVGNKLLRRAFDNRVTMVTGMTRCYRRYVLGSLALESDGKEIHLEIVSKALALGYRIAEIPAYIEWKKNISGKKRRSSFRARRLIISHLLFSFSEYPWLIFGVVGGGVFGLGVMAGLVSLYGQLRYMFADVKVEPYVALVNPATVVLLLLFGLQILIFNFIAYQNKMLRQDNIRMQRSLKQLDERITNNAS